MPIRRSTAAKLFLRKISQEEALRHADSRNNLSLRFRLEQGVLNQAAPPKREVSFNRKAPFDHYRRFSIRPVKVSRERRPDIIEVLTRGICQVFMQISVGFGRSQLNCILPASNRSNLLPESRVLPPR
jgi:hypothetical protein